MEPNICWVIKNGHKVRFWKDPWVPSCGRIEDHLLFSIPVGADNFPVSSFGDIDWWHWDRFWDLLPNWVCDKIYAIQPPSPGQDDSIC